MLLKKIARLSHSAAQRNVKLGQLELAESGVQWAPPAKGNSTNHHAEWPVSADKGQQSPLRL